MKNRIVPATIYIMLLFVLFTGCADAIPIKACVIDEPYGFLSGLWHGIIVPISFVGSLFCDSIAIYAVNNDGGWYDFGFVLGAGILFTGCSNKIK